MGRKAPSRVRIPPSPLPAPALGRRLHSCIAAPVAQLDRASVYGTEGQRVESSRARFPTGSVAGLSVGLTPKLKFRPLVFEPLIQPLLVLWRTRSERLRRARPRV